jgi:hypothetical protein
MLDGLGIESWWGARFSAFVQTGPGAHTASSTMGTWSFLGVKRPGHDIYHPHPSSTEIIERAQLYRYSTSGPLCPVIARTLPSPFNFTYKLPKPWNVNSFWIRPLNQLINLGTAETAVPIFRVNAIESALTRCVKMWQQLGLLPLLSDCHRQTGTPVIYVQSTLPVAPDWCKCFTRSINW